MRRLLGLARALADWFSLAAHGAQFTYGSECIVGATRREVGVGRFSPWQDPGRAAHPTCAYLIALHLARRVLPPRGIIL